MIHGESAKRTPLLLAAITPIEIAMLLMGNGYANYLGEENFFFVILENAQKEKKRRKEKKEFHTNQTEFHITV